ncbi:unnamed protein product [Ranitomeya imitator]|uniref:Immunoglobulin V-set domain-containing protein n=1 Tax=Ranitomeya imitator TaxID=111125 RepID=A0ABN9LWD7_9NEOB|nr:unnamed protein product [Ranitomeya imitator]
MSVFKISLALHTVLESFSAVLLLFTCINLSRSQKIEYIARSSDVTFHFGPCELNSVFKLQYGGVTAHIPCDSSPQIPHRWEDRRDINKTTGSITLHNVTRSDEGYYTLVRTNRNGKNEKLSGVTVRVLDPVWIAELYHNDTERTISFTVFPVEDPGAFNWTVNGRDLLDRRWLSPDNRTLTIPYNYTQDIMVSVSNLVSSDRKSITPIRDLNGTHGRCDQIMRLNTAKVIWGESEGHTGNGTPILPRNITNICVLIPSDKMDDPHSGGYRSRHHFALITIPVAIVFSIILLAVLWKKSPQMEIRLRNDDMDCSLRLTKNGSLEKISHIDFGPTV